MVDMTRHTLQTVDTLLSAKPWEQDGQCDTFDKWKTLFFDQLSGLQHSMDMAVTGGFFADRVAFAFAAGYHAAIHKLVPGLPCGTVISLCVTEKDGNHPRAIQSRLEPLEGTGPPAWRLNGTKQFVTCAAEAELLLVAASTGTGRDGKNRLKLVLLERPMPGLGVEVMKDLPFVPEISHGIVQLNDVVVQDSNILPGDGYTSYIKPFRTLEDLHVNGAILAYLFRVAMQFNWPRETGELILSLITTAAALSDCDPSLPPVHIVTAGLLAQTKQLIKDIEPLWNNTGHETRTAWERDNALMNIAEKARARRLHAAWSHYNTKGKYPNCLS
jgi:hypothetical protein